MSNPISIICLNIHLLPYEFAANKANHKQNNEAYVAYSFFPLSILVCNKKHSKQKLLILNLCGEEYKNSECVCS